MLPRVEGFVLWLLTDNSRQPFYHKTILECANIFNGPFFVPHITLGRIPENKRELASGLIHRLAKEDDPFSMETLNVQCRENPYQKLVITLQQEGKYLDLCEAADACFEEECSKRKDPHISLLYGYQDCGIIKNKIESIQSSTPQTAEVNEIAIVELNGRPVDWKIAERVEFRSLL